MHLCAAQLFRMHPGYRESLVIDGVEEEGDTARLATRRTETTKGGHYREARQVETWKQREGRWMLMAERAANPSGGGPRVVRRRRGRCDRRRDERGRIG